MRFSNQYQNLIYQPNYIHKNQKQEILDYLSTLHPIWEMRFSASNPPPADEPNRQLLRPVYWLGNWQFACLNYYHPPQGIQNRCVRAEDYPQVLQQIVFDIEHMVRQKFSPKDIPDKWHLNTCLVNFYGDQISETGARTDCARVGEHKDFEPGPVASVSFGEKAMFQFVKSAGKSSKSEVVLQQWLEDSSLQIFGGDKFKKQLFHRVQRVEDKGIVFKNLNTTKFETRRINFTFRYVPTEHVRPFDKLPDHLQADVKNYVTELSGKSEYWKEQL
ncbi:MAG: alpha-ketoglutarate-dependent dioxygenase AlkB [Bdellovibrio sp.]|nr:alpha-ketoglutarate-dependent dioxygenase AlkB [Bdellovibrio sp.]